MCNFALATAKHVVCNSTGKMPEWSIGAVSKTVKPFGFPGFESLSFRKALPNHFGSAF